MTNIYQIAYNLNCVKEKKKERRKIDTCRYNMYKQLFVWCEADAVCIILQINANKNQGSGSKQFWNS